MLKLRVCGVARGGARSVTLAALVLAGAYGGAAAEAPGAPHWLYDRMATTTLERGQFYVGFTLNAVVQRLPRINSPVSIFDGAVAGDPFVGPRDFKPELLGVQPGGEIGYVFRDGSFPSPMGSRVRVAVFGSFLDQESTKNQSFVTPAAASALYHGVNGQPIVILGVGGGTYAETLKAQRQAWQIGLKLESEIALGRNLSLTPAIAVFGGRIVDSYSGTSGFPNVVGSGVDLLPASVNERLRTREIGGHFGARLAWQFVPGWALHFGGTAGPVWMRTRLTAEDCLNIDIVPLGAPCGPSNAMFFSTSASDSRSTVAFRGTASLGIVADLRYLLVSLGGFMRYDSRIPGIVNPQLTNFAALGTTLAPAHIRFDDGFAYGGFVTLRVPFPH